jgi:hypothetical protein
MLKRITVTHKQPAFTPRLIEHSPVGNGVETSHYRRYKFSRDNAIATVEDLRSSLYADWLKAPRQARGHYERAIYWTEHYLGQLENLDYLPGRSWSEATAGNNGGYYPHPYRSAIREAILFMTALLERLKVRAANELPRLFTLVIPRAYLALGARNPDPQSEPPPISPPRFVLTGAIDAMAPPLGYRVRGMTNAYKHSTAITLNPGRILHPA